MIRIFAARITDDCSPPDTVAPKPIIVVICPGRFRRLPNLAPTRLIGLIPRRDGVPLNHNIAMSLLYVFSS